VRALLHPAITGFLRHVLGGAGTFLVAIGWLSEEELAGLTDATIQILGGGFFIAALLWSLWDKRNRRAPRPLPPGPPDPPGSRPVRLRVG